MYKGKLILTRKNYKLIDEEGRDILQLAEIHKFKVSAVASNLQVNVSRLEAAIKAATSQTPKELFRQHRIALTKHYVRMGIVPNHVVKILGYSHYTHLAKEVKHYFKMTVTDWVRTERKRCMDPAHSFS